MFGALSCSLNRSLIRSQRRNYIVLCLMTFTCICIRPTRWNNIACPMMSQDGADMHNMSFKCMQNKWRQLAQKCTSSIRLSKFLSAKGQTCNLPRVMHALPSTTQLGASLTYTDALLDLAGCSFCLFIWWLQPSACLQTKPFLSYGVLVVNLAVYAAGVGVRFSLGESSGEDYFYMLAKVNDEIVQGEYYRCTCFHLLLVGVATRCADEIGHAMLACSSVQIDTTQEQNLCVMHGTVIRG